MNKISYCGVIGSGKSHSSSVLSSNGYVKISFADAVRKVLYKSLRLENISVEEYERLKLQDIAILDKNYVVQKINFRDALINLGHGMRQEFEDTWLFFWDKLYEKLGKPERVVCDDVRYANEFWFLWNKGFKIIFTNFKSPKYSKYLNLTEPQEPEKLATAFVALGYEHGVELLPKDLERAKTYVDENFPYK